MAAMPPPVPRREQGSAERQAEPGGRQRRRSDSRECYSACTLRHSSSAGCALTAPMGDSSARPSAHHSRGWGHISLLASALASSAAGADVRTRRDNYGTVSQLQQRDELPPTTSSSASSVSSTNPAGLAGMSARSSGDSCAQKSASFQA